MLPRTSTQRTQNNAQTQRTHPPPPPTTHNTNSTQTTHTKQRTNNTHKTTHTHKAPPPQHAAHPQLAVEARQPPLARRKREVDVRVGARRHDVEFRVVDVDALGDAQQPRHREGLHGLVLADERLVAFFCFLFRVVFRRRCWGVLLLVVVCRVFITDALATIRSTIPPSTLISYLIISHHISHLHISHHMSSPAISWYVDVTMKSAWFIA